MMDRTAPQPATGPRACVTRWPDVWAIGLLIVTLSSHPETTFAQFSQKPGTPPTPAQTVQDEQAFRRAVAELDIDGEDSGILGRPGAIKGAGALSVASLLNHGNRYVKALAIAELKNRRDISRKGDIARLFDTTALDVKARRPDSHDVDAITPDVAVLASAAEYLASIDKLSFLPTLLGRKETWMAPHWFAGAFRHLGKGWMRASLESVTDPAHRAALGYFIRAGAMPENIDELRDALGSDDAAIWRSALVACERLNDDRCWASVDASIDARDAVDRLTARLAQWRMGNAPHGSPFQAAADVARAAQQEPAGPALARMWNALDEFARLAVESGTPMPLTLVDDLRRLGSPGLVEHLHRARIK